MRSEVLLTLATDTLLEHLNATLVTDGGELVVDGERDSPSVLTMGECAEIVAPVLFHLTNRSLLRPLLGSGNTVQQWRNLRSSGYLIDDWATTIRNLWLVGDTNHELVAS